MPAAPEPDPPVEPASLGNMGAVDPPTSRRSRVGSPRGGGFAGDQHLTCSSGERPGGHDDPDVAMLRRDQAALRSHLPGWDLQYATPQHSL